MGQNVFLARVADLDSGSRTALRRAAGLRLADADGKALTAFYKAYPPRTDEASEDSWFQAACLQCLWKTEDLTRAIPLAKAGSQMNEQEQAAFERRMVALLDISRGSGSYFAVKLYRLVRYCKAKECVVDCSDLITDLQHWDDETRAVQRKWAKMFYGTQQDQKIVSNNKEEKEDAR